MDAARFAELSAWWTEAGRGGEIETEIVDVSRRRAIDSGLPLARGMVIIDTLHPVHEGRVFRWRSDGEAGQIEAAEYGPTDEGEVAENWRRSPFFWLLESGGARLRKRLDAGQTPEFPAIVALQQE